MFDLDYLTNSMNYEPISLENQANKSASPIEANHSACTQANDDQGANLEEIDLHDEHFILPIWSAYLTTVKSSRDKIPKTYNFKKYEKPASQVEQIFQEELEKLKRQEKEANDATRKEATHENQNANTNSTNLLNAVSTPISTVGPSRALNDVEPSYPDDPLMPHLEDIFASPSEGIFTDSSFDDEGVTRSKVHKNSESHALWNPKRFLKHWKMKVGLILCKRNCCSSRYRRIEAIRIFLAFASYIGFIVYQMNVKSTFLYGTIDEEGYVTQPSGFVYPKFPNKDKYVVEILKKFDFLSVKTASTPIETQKPIVKDKEAADVDIHLYRSMIGSLMYMTASRPDIMFAVCACSRFQVTSKTSYLQAVKRIFRYLKGQPKLGLWYPKVTTFDLEAYSDSDYAGVNLDRKSTTRDAYEKKLIQVLKIHTDDNVADLLTKAFDVRSKELASPKQTTLSKDESNMLIVDSLLKTIWSSMHHVIAIKHWLFQSKRLLLKVNVASLKLQLLRTMASAIICLATNQKFNFSRYILLSLVKNIEAGVPFYVFLRELVLVFFGVITPLFENMLVLAAEEVGQAQDDVSIPTEPSTSKPYKKHNPRNSNQKHLSLKFQELMDLCTKLSNKVLDLESEVIDIKSYFTDKIEKLEERVHKLEEENRILQETSFKSAKIDTVSLKKSNKNVIGPKNVIDLLVNVSFVMNRLVGVNGLRL
nr:hypothetical protein [Tanacetum cinerariifolium]